jgi:hypothetical protein
VHSEERAISLSWKLLLLLYQPRLARNRFRSGNSVRHIHLFGHTFDHDYYFELPREGEREPDQSSRPTALLVVLLEAQHLFDPVVNLGSAFALESDGLAGL